MITPAGVCEEEPIERRSETETRQKRWRTKVAVVEERICWWIRPWSVRKQRGNIDATYYI